MFTPTIIKPVSKVDLFNDSCPYQHCFFNASGECISNQMANDLSLESELRQELPNTIECRHFKCAHDICPECGEPLPKMNSFFPIDEDYDHPLCNNPDCN